MDEKEVKMPEKIEKKYQIERRRHRRLKQKFRVRFKKFIFPFSEDNEIWHSAVISNISACGAYIYMQRDFLEEEIKKGDMLQMEIELGRWNEYKANDRPFDYYYQREPLTVLGKIVRMEKMEEGRYIQVGIDFIGVDETHKRMVLKYIEKRINENKSDNNKEVL